MAGVFVTSGNQITIASFLDDTPATRAGIADNANIVIVTNERKWREKLYRPILRSVFNSAFHGTLRARELNR